MQFNFDNFDFGTYATLILLALILLLIGLVSLGNDHRSDLNKANIKGHRIKNGPYGDARFATKAELKRDYQIIDFEPLKWRKGENLPKEPGYLIGDWHEGGKIVNSRGLPKYIDKNGKWHGGKVKSYLCTDDTHALLVASSGAGKTSFYLDPNLEYALATGISFLATDTKGDLDRQLGLIARNNYGYKTVMINLRSPMRSSKFNILHMVSKYTQLYKEAAAKDPNSEETLMYQARRETYAKICAKTIITSGTDGNFGQNSFFYDSAEGLLTACILLVCEYSKPEEQHIISVYKLIQSISGSETDNNGDSKTEVQKLLDLLPDDSKIKMFAGASAQSGGEGQASVLSTAMSRLISFLDSETEQILCFDSDIDAENFVSEKTMIILTMPEEFNTRYFMVSLIVQELYRELLTIADIHGGKVPGTAGFRGKKPRVMFYLDEFGTLPKIDSAAMMFSAARSRNIFFVPIVQGTIQLDRNYGKEGGAIIRDNCQLQMFTGISPSSSDAETFSKMLGTYSARGASVSRQSHAIAASSKASKTDSVVSVNLMTADEIRTMPKGTFIIMRTGKHPIMANFDLFLDWGIPPYVNDSDPKINSGGEVHYASREEIEANIMNSKSIEKVKASATDETVENAIKKGMETKAKDMTQDTENTEDEPVPKPTPVHQDEDIEPIDDDFDEDMTDDGEFDDSFFDTDDF